MTARSVTRWRVVSGFVVVGLVVSGLVVVGRVPSVETPTPLAVVGPASPVAGGVAGLGALPSSAPAVGFGDGGGGLGTATWGLFGDPSDDSEVMRAGGVQVDLGAPGWGAGAVFAVFDAGTSDQLWPASGMSSSSTVPAGILRNGGAYEVAVDVDGVTTRRAFTVNAALGQATAGVVTAGQSSTPVAVNTGQKMAVGLQFSSADVGVTAATGAVGRLSVGLPAGWSWSGVGADVWRVEVVDGSASLPGVERIVKVFGKGVLLLGCSIQGTGSVCDTADGQLAGEGPRALVAADGSVVLTEQSVGQTLSFDPQGRLVQIAQPGAPVVGVSYTAAGGLDAVRWEVGATPVVWQAVYAGDSGCDDSGVGAGFVATPTGFVCGWVDPAGVRTRVVYSQPAGASVPRISRIVQLPAGCAASMVGCDPNQSAIADFGWDANNRLAQMRDTLTARAAAAGLIDPADASHWQQLTYDPQGRLTGASGASPVLDGRGILAPQANTVTARMVYGAAEAGFAPATRQLEVTTRGTSATIAATTTAMDEGGRTVAARAASGAVTRSVWAPFDDVLLATIYPNDQAETTVFDQWFRREGKHHGPIDAFPAGCAPDSPARGVTDATSGDWTACAPPAVTTQVASQLIGFDDPAGVGNGLTVAQFAPASAGLPSPFSGNPVAHSAADQTESGIPMASVTAGAASGSGVRFDGGVVVPVSAGSSTDPWTVTVEVPDDLVTGGVVVVNGKFCALLSGGSGGGQGSCTVTPDAEARAQHLTVDLQLARAPQPADQLVIALQDPLGDPPVVDNTFLVRRWSADTALTTHDPVPAGSIAGWSGYHADHPHVPLWDAHRPGRRPGGLHRLGRHGGP